MKKLLLLSCLVSCVSFAYAQQCTPDTSYPDGFIGLYPLPDVDLDGIASVPETPACIGEFYSYTFTVVVPGSVVIPGVPVPIGITSAEIVGVSGLPSGLSISDCSPSNCNFIGGQTGCFKITGTPDASNPEGDYPLEIDVKLNNVIQPINIVYPPDPTFNLFELPAYPYSIKVRASGQCTSPTTDLSETVSISDNFPNPFSGSTQIKVATQEAGDYQFSVYNLLGEQMMQCDYFLTSGENIIEYDGSDLAAGVYIYTISNEKGSVSKKMMVGR